MFHPRELVENQDQTRQNILQVTDRHLENLRNNLWNQNSPAFQ